MAILKAHERDYINQVFRLVEDPVTLTFFTQEHENQTVKETREILEELASISDKIILNEYDFDKHKDKASSFQISQVPGTVLAGKKDYGIRYYGAPSGYLVSSVIENIILLSKDESELSQRTKEKLKSIVKPVRLQIMATSTSPHCPSLANITHRLAMENDKISAYVINIVDFPHLAMRYNVVEVPLTIVNEKDRIEGAPNEDDFVDKLVKIIKE